MRSRMPGRQPVAEAVGSVRNRVAEACRRSGRAPGEVRIVAASKGVPAELVREAVAAGLHDVGENRAQELRDKAAVLPPEVRWHFLGGLQTNKVRYLDRVVLVHSLDRLEEASSLQRRGERFGRDWDALIEVNIGGETSKQGIRPEELESFLESVSAFQLIRPCGLMIVAPQAEKADDVRWVFASARELRDRIGGPAVLKELSMGMTDDFEIAIEEGATLVRIGRAIFRGE